MTNVEFLVKATVDFDLFEAFAYFIVARKLKNDTPTKKEYHEELNKILQLDMVDGSLENKLSRARTHKHKKKNIFVFELPKESYDRFCNEFDVAFKKLGEQQDDYKDIQIAFIDGRKE